jgi:beta-lactam-binding protein with PASTA domain
MKRVLLIAGLCSLLGCPLQASSSSTMPSGGGGSPGNGGGDSGSSGNVTVPDLVGKTQSEAEAAVASAGLRGGIRVDNDPGTWTASTKVCTQTPGSGQQSASSLFVSVRFCLEEKPYVDDEGVLSGMTLDAAKKKIKDAGFTGEVTVTDLYEYDKDCKDGTVCRFDPRRWYLPGERHVTLYINKKTTIVVPD